MKAIVRRREYEFPLGEINGEPELFIIERHDSDRLIMSDRINVMSNALESCITGVHSVEYNGHFGNAIHLIIDAEYDSFSTRRKVKKFIKNWIAGKFPE